MIKTGIDVSSTTAKLAAVDENGNLLFSEYERHSAKAKETILSFPKELLSEIGDKDTSMRITDSIGMGISERCSLPFVQEVVAATEAIQKDYSHVTSMIDVGEEDMRVVFFKDAEATDLCMNGNRIEGTGVFIDQIAVILGVNIDKSSQFAMSTAQVYPVASRRGAFCKTDIQNLIAENVSRENIAASISRVVAVQTVVTLVHGCGTTAPVLLCGGPLTFIPALRKAFIDYLSLDEKEITLPANGTSLPALGAALFHLDKEDYCRLPHLIDKTDTILSGNGNLAPTGSEPVFTSNGEYETWKERISRHRMMSSGLKIGAQDIFIGIGSGSATTKIIVLDEDSRLLYSYYNINGGNPMEAVEEGLNQLNNGCLKQNTVLNIKRSCSTGYGEDLARFASQFHPGTTETIAHCMAAHYLNEDASSILDIGRQNTKAIFVNNGVTDQMEINGACSFGCGSFSETFVKSLEYSAREFPLAACHSEASCDLGTRCTIFMNSKMKQILRGGAVINGIAAGLAYSVVKSCLYKVLKLKDISVLGKDIVMQGGVMRNDAVIRAIELLSRVEVARRDTPELMGTLGCVLYATKYQGESVSLDEIINRT